MKSWRFCYEWSLAFTGNQNIKEEDAIKWNY